jgi:hypothetical protein
MKLHGENSAVVRDQTFNITALASSKQMEASRNLDHVVFMILTDVNMAQTSLFQGFEEAEFFDDFRHEVDFLYVVAFVSFLDFGFEVVGNELMAKTDSDNFKFG